MSDRVTLADCLADFAHLRRRLHDALGYGARPAAITVTGAGA